MNIDTRFLRVRLETDGEGFNWDLWVHPGIAFPLLFLLAIGACYWLRFGV